MRTHTKRASMRLILAVFVFCAGALTIAFQTHVFAQAPAAPETESVAPVAPPQPEALQAPAEAQEEPLMKVRDSAVDPKDMQSLLFTFWEHNALVDARNSRGSVRAPTAAELEGALRNNNSEARIKPPPEERYITLGGIAYVSHGDWTIWLNSERITPEALPPEIIDLQVYKEYIELKWFDAYSNQVYPIRLKPHQRFNIDTRIFLPG